MRTRRAVVLGAGVVVFIFTLTGFLWSNDMNIPSAPSFIGRKSRKPWTNPKVLPPIPANATSSLAANWLEHIMRPTVKPNTQKYSPFGAFGWGLPDGPVNWVKPLKEDFCIIDLDNRKFNEPGQIWADMPMSWERPEEVHGLSVGILNHWAYAKIHGYKYYYVDIEEFADRRNSWKKPPIMAQILRNHKVCIFIDSDALFNHMDLPFEWLMNYWGLSPETNSLALASDPPEDHNKDKYGKYYLNTGFIVAQNNDKTFEIFDAWEGCPEENGKHPECVKFRKADPGQPTDQGGFGTFIRYDYPKDIKELPCNEANGYPQSESKCHGDFIRHLWRGKDDWIKITAGEGEFSGDVLETLHRQFLREKEYFYLTEAELMSFK